MTISTDKQRRPIAEMRAVAAEVLALLAPACVRCEIAGSIRRGSALCSDVELVYIPKIERIALDLFGTKHLDCDLLDELCDDLLLKQHVLEQRLDSVGRPAWGLKYKRARYRGIGLDIFATTAESWGLIQIIRTGPARYSHWLVTQQHQGGAMPFGMQSKGGQLWRGNTVIPTPDEVSVYTALGLEFVEPQDRQPPAEWREPGERTT